MRTTKLKMTAAGALVALFSMTAAISGCAEDPDEPNNGTVDACPSERSVRCPDDSCVAQADQCPSEQPFCPAETPARCPDDSCAKELSECPSEQPDEIDGDIVGMRPTTILAHAPEPVELMLSVEDAPAVQSVLEDGGSWRVLLETADGEMQLDAEGARSPADAEHDFTVVFTPEPTEGPQQIAVTLELEDGRKNKVYAWGRSKLNGRGDGSSLDFEDRLAMPIEGLSNADRTWGDDLDGDGFDDLVVSNLEADANGRTQSTLHLFKCGPDRCEPAGQLSTTAANGDQIVVPDQIVAPDMTGTDEPTGFLAAAVTGRDANGEMMNIEVIWAEIIDGADGLSLRDTRVKFDLRQSIEGGRLHDQTLQPRLLRDDLSGDVRPGLTITSTDALRGETQWSTLVMGDGSVIAEYRGRRVFEGLDDAQTQAALGGELAVCLSGDTRTLSPKAPPQGVIVSAFDLDGSAALAVAGIDEMRVPARVLELGNQVDSTVLDGDYGSVHCKLGDLDGDGHDDLIVSVAADGAFSRLGAALGQPSSLFLAMGMDSAGDLPGLGAPQLVIEGIDAASHGFMKAADELVLDIDIDTSGEPIGFGSFSISKRSARTGRNPQVAVDIDHDGQGNIRLSTQEVSLTPPGIPIYSKDRIGQPTALGGGDDIILRKKPGRTKYGDITLKKSALVGATQLVGDLNSPTLAHFGPGIGDADEDSDDDGLLQITDPESILGSIGTTGPFNPVETSNGDNGQVGQHAEILYLPAVDDRATPLLLQLKVDSRGKPAQIVTHAIVVQGERVTLENETTFDFDTSDVTLEEGKKVTKFKAGAELSKSVNAQAPDGGGDCDDTEACPRPGEVLLAMQIDDGDVWTAVLDVESGAAPKLRSSSAFASLLRELGLDASADLSGLRTTLRTGHVDGEPVAMLAGVRILGDSLDEQDESFMVIGRDGNVGQQDSLRQASSDPLTVFGDVLGSSADQRVVCRPADGGTLSCSVAELGESAPVMTWTSAVEVDGDVKCVVDIDGDRCGDLVTSAGEFISSRCDGSFEPATVELGSWTSHMVCGGDTSGPNRVQDYNSSRSNKPNTIKWDESDDHDGPAVSFPFYDGLSRPAWE